MAGDRTFEGHAKQTMGMSARPEQCTCVEPHSKMDMIGNEISQVFKKALVQRRRYTEQAVICSTSCVIGLGREAGRHAS